jgi:hypothetical protein
VLSTAYSVNLTVSTESPTADIVYDVIDMSSVESTASH